jgi:pre-mRNA-splicing factor SYF1
MYAVFMIKQDHFITQTRRVLDSSLQALPLTQHPMMWILYLEFAEKVAGETCIRIWKRYLKIEPDALEDYVDILLEMDPPRPAEAAKVLAKVLSTPGYKSTSGKSNFQLWSHLADLVTEYPDEMESSVILKGGKLESLDVDVILRAGIARFTDQVGKIWNSLARWWILKGEWEKARDVYEEALASVGTLRDFSLVFDTYAKTEEDLLAAQMDALGSGSKDIDELEVDMGLARFERLMERRPFLLNDVLLRQNPHNVSEWKSRILLWEEKENPNQVKETYETALSTINSKKAVGSLPDLWIDFANFSLKKGDIDAARNVYERAVTASFKNADDLVEIWCSYAELELDAGEEKRASMLLSRACAPPKLLTSAVALSIRYDDERRDPLQRVFKSLKIWSLYVDIEEAIGTIESTKAVYDRIIELKIALPQTILNYASFLEEKNFFEEVIEFKLMYRASACMKEG